MAKARRGALRQTRARLGEQRYGPQVSNVAQAPVSTRSGGLPSRVQGEAALDDHGNRLMTVTSPGGVMTAARSEGLYRNR